jgi:hypothetical protein
METARTGVGLRYGRIMRTRVQWDSWASVVEAIVAGDTR